MNSASPASHHRARFLRWLGLGPEPESDSVRDAPSPADPLEATSRQAAADIGEFLARHRLAPTHLTLAAAHDCISGNDPELAEQVRKRQAAGDPVTPEWLAHIRTMPTPDDETTALRKLMDRMEGTIVDFSHTTRDARTATSAYSSALSSHVDDLHMLRPDGSLPEDGHMLDGAVLGELVALTRAMLERTRAIEDQIARSDRETRALHRNLEDARRSAEIDHLTGLPNRRAFEDRFEREVLAARAAGEPLCVAFCDIDRFKRINDTHGHDAGDRVLRVIARAFNAISNEKCHVARHGGEEFVVLLRGKTLAEAYRILDDMRSAVADRRMVNRATDVPFGKVSFSAGVADVLTYADPRAALKAADEALYVAKNEGRNRVVQAPARLPPLASSKAA